MKELYAEESNNNTWVSLAALIKPSQLSHLALRFYYSLFLCLRPLTPSACSAVISLSLSLSLSDYHTVPVSSVTFFFSVSLLSHYIFMSTHTHTLNESHVILFPGSPTPIISLSFSFSLCLSPSVQQSPVTYGNNQ